MTRCSVDKRRAIDCLLLEVVAGFITPNRLFRLVWQNKNAQGIDPNVDIVRNVDFLHVKLLPVTNNSQGRTLVEKPELAYR